MTAAPSRATTCARCRAKLPLEAHLHAPMTACPLCANPLQVALFPAFVHGTGASAARAEAVVAEGQSACFYHQDKLAVTPCDACGRFLCALCDIELQGRHLCPACLEAGAKSRRIETLERARTRWDVLASQLVLLSLFLFFLAPVVTLAVLVMVFATWKSPPSLVARSRVRLAVSGVFAALLMAASLVFWFSVFKN